MMMIMMKMEDDDDDNDDDDDEDDVDAGVNACMRDISMFGYNGVEGNIGDPRRGTKKASGKSADWIPLGPNSTARILVNGVGKTYL